MITQRLFVALTFALVGPTWSQPLPVPPSDVEPLGKLAFEARQKLNDWLGSPDLNEILARSPVEALAGIDMAASQMRDYKAAEMRLYDRVGRDLDEKIRLLQLNAVDWKKTFENRAQGIDRDTEAIFDQEQKLQAQVDALSANPSAAAERYQNELKAQIVQLQQLQLKLARQRVLYQAAARQESPEDIKTALGGLRAQRQEIDRLKTLATQSRDRLDGFYKYLGDSVREKLPQPGPVRTASSVAGTKTPQTSTKQKDQSRDQRTPAQRGYRYESETTPPASQPMNPGQVRITSSDGVRTIELRDDRRIAIGKTWVWSRPDREGGRLTPSRIEFTAVELHGETLTSRVGIWFDGQGSTPDTLFERNCSVAGSDITCTALDSTTLRIASQNQDRITAEMPTSLDMSASGVRRTAHGDEKWEIKGVLNIQIGNTRGSGRR